MMTKNKYIQFADDEIRENDEFSRIPDDSEYIRINKMQVQTLYDKGGKEGLIRELVGGMLVLEMDIKTIQKQLSERKQNTLPKVHIAEPEVVEESELIANPIYDVLLDLDGILQNAIDEDDEIAFENYLTDAKDTILDLWEVGNNMPDYVSGVFSLFPVFMQIHKEEGLTREQIVFIRSIIDDILAKKLEYSFTEYEKLLAECLKRDLDSMRLMRVKGGW